jgi:hypothetical protein
MAKLYIKNSKHLETLKPSEETVNFLLNYSKTLKIISFNDLKFEALLN